VKLHIGGESRKDGWSILNIQPKEGVDFIGTITNLSQFEDESVDEIYASHVLEHVLQTEVAQTLKGIYRILKPLGKLYISVPDLDILCQIFINPKAPKDVKYHAMRMMFGGQLDNFDIHYTGWNQEILLDFLQLTGFSEGARVESFGIFSDTSDAKPYGFPISLNVIAIK
jgi:predicted SAM-dependent methyltransferase